MEAGKRVVYIQKTANGILISSVISHKTRTRTSMCSSHASLYIPPPPLLYILFPFGFLSPLSYSDRNSVQLALLDCNVGSCSPDNLPAGARIIVIM
jgi:hypothetical protein